MAYSYRASQSGGNSSGSTVSLPKPAGTADGDLLLVGAYLESDTNTWSTIGAGYAEWTSASIANTGAFNLRVYWKWASGESASSTWAPASSAWRSMVTAAYSGATSSGNPPDVTSASQGDAVLLSNQVAPSVTTTAANDLLAFIYGNFSGTDGSTAGPAASNFRISLGGTMLADANIASAGSTGVTGPGGGPGTETYAAIHAAFLLAAGPAAAGNLTGTASGTAGHVANISYGQLPAAVTLGSVASTTAASTYATTTTYTPTANRLVIVAVQNTKAGLPDVPTVFGHGLTFTSIATRTFNTIASASSRVSLYWAIGSSPTSGSTSASFSANQTGCSISVVEWAGLETAYSSASTVVQSAASAGNSVPTLSVPFAAFSDPGNAGYAALASSASVAINPRGSWTEIHDLTYNTPTTRLETQWIRGSDTAASGSPTSGSPNLGIIAIELLKAGTARGTIPGVAGHSASISNAEPAGSISGTIAGTASQSGTLTGRGALAGTIPGTASQSATLRVLAPITGTIPGTAAQTATLTGRGALTGTIPGSAAQVGTLTGTGALTGTIPGVAAQAGTLTGSGALSGAAQGVSTATGTLSGTAPSGDIAGAAAGTSTALADIGGVGTLTGNQGGTSGTTGSIIGAGYLISSAAGTSTAALTLTGLGIIDGAAIGQAIILAALLGYGALQGQGDGMGTARGTLQSVIPATGPGTRDIITASEHNTLEAQTTISQASARVTLKAARSAISAPGRNSPKSQG